MTVCPDEARWTTVHCCWCPHVVTAVGPVPAHSEMDRHYETKHAVEGDRGRPA